MDDRGNIYDAEAVQRLRKQFEEREGEAKKAAGKKLSKLLPIENHELAEVSKMNRAQRRAWYSKKRKAAKRNA